MGLALLGLGCLKVRVGKNGEIDNWDLPYF